MQAVGVDVGYGATKVAGGAGGGHVFESAWVACPRGAEAWGIGSADRPLVVDGARVLVGDLAASRPGAHRPFADGRLADPEALPLLAAALWHAGVQGDVVLGSGMPLGTFAQERDAARRALEGRTLALGDGTHVTTVRIARLVLRPQGVGAALYLASRGCLGGAGYTCIIDIGTRTTDVVTLEAPDLSPVMPLCFTFEAGVATAAEAVAQVMQADTGHLPPPDVTLAALRRQVTWRGRVLGGAAAALDALAAGIRDEILRRFGADAGRVATTTLVGGGSVLLGSRLAGFLPGATATVAPQDALFANAEGFRWAAEHPVA